MRRYLFIGGPRDGEWHGVRYHLDAPAHPYLVHDPNPFLERSIRWRYYRRTVMVPGWLVPLDVYVLDGMTEIPRETVLPGFAYGRMEAWPYLWTVDAARCAVAAFNRGRLSR